MRHLHPLCGGCPGAGGQLVQLRADPALRGRVTAVWFMALPGTMPFTGFLSGLVARAAGARAGFALAGAALLITVFLTWRSLDR